MKNFVCLYSVDYLNLNNNIVTEHGLIYADNFVDAVTQLEQEIYGNDLIKINEIELFDKTGVFSKEIYNLLKEDLREP